MSDDLSTPILSRSDDIGDKLKHRPSLGDTIERYIGEFCSSQLLQAVLVSFACVFDAQQTFVSVFTDVEPTWHCIDESCNAVSNICQLSKKSWSWDFPVHASVISEWGLECSSPLIKGLPSSCFFMGCLAGGIILATLADSSLGRKNMLFLSCLMMSVSCIVNIFSNNIWMYSALKFINGFGRAMVGTSAIVLSTELVGKRWRGKVGAIGFLCFMIGFLSLPAIAYVNRGSSWRTLYLWISIPTILYCILVRFLVRESPRWLFIQGRKEEAVSIIKSISSPNQSSLIMDFNDVSIEQENWNVDLYSGIKILIEKNWALRRLSAILIVGFGIGMVYYGIPLGLGNLSFNLYLSVTFNALSELPASLIIFVLIGKLNRKNSLLVFTITSGICSILCVVMGKTLKSMQIALELVAFFSACTAFNLLILYTIELFPTCVRNTALSMVRQAPVFGGVFSPMLVVAGRENEFLSYGIFGLVIGLCGLFLIGLPETRDRPLSDTMDEEEFQERSLDQSKISFA